MNEKIMRKGLVKKLASLDAFSVENPMHPGTPDVNFVEGWLELKYMKQWSKNADVAPVLCKHFTPQQRVWLRRRSIRGGNVWLLVQIGSAWLLLEGAVAAQHFGRSTRPQLLAVATKYWEHRLNIEELIKCLSCKNENSKK